jgi:hypothetical protein
MSKDIEISQVKAVIPDPDAAVIVLKAEALMDDAMTELEIAITTDLAPSVAIALLAITARARAARDGMDPALEVLAAAVVATGNAEKVRLHLLFDKGGVLPVEMPTAAGHALTKGLVHAAGGEQAS